MKRLFLSLIAAMISAMGMYAQTSLVATLQHGSNIQAFYGEDALVDAYEAASEGDVITLSGGSFNVVNTFEKAITIKGSGMESSSTTQQTNINGAFTVNAPSESGKIFSMEGIYCEKAISIGSNAQFIKCKFTNEVFCGGNNCTTAFIHCFITSNKFHIYSQSINRNVFCQNCYLSSVFCGGTNNTFILENSTINSAVGSLTSSTRGYLMHATLKNCIIWNSSSFNSSSVATNFFSNCLLCNVSDISRFANADISSCTILDGEQSNTVFTSGSSDPKSCYGKLTDEAAATYLGSDGTQVGMYGGEHPFSMTPSYPFVKRLDVSTSRDDDKVNLRINVE